MNWEHLLWISKDPRRLPDPPRAAEEEWAGIGLHSWLGLQDLPNLDFMIRAPRWPYAVGPGIRHLVVWSKAKRSRA